jgi:hypothetical protein
MSTQSYTPNHQATSQQGSGPSWFRIWAVVVGTAVAVTFIVLAVGLWHGHSSTAPATNGTPSSTSVPAHPTAPVVPPAHPTAPVTPAHGAGGSGN